MYIYSYLNTHRYPHTSHPPEDKSNGAVFMFLINAHFVFTFGNCMHQG